MATDSLSCSFIQASMAGSRLMAPLNRKNAVPMVAPSTCLFAEASELYLESRTDSKPLVSDSTLVTWADNPGFKLSSSAGWMLCAHDYLGLTPQALCCRPLRGL